MGRLFAYLIPVAAAGVGLYLLFKPEEAAAAPADMRYQPSPLPPGQAPATTPGGVRAQEYMLKLDGAATAWRMAVPFLREQQRTMVMGTVEVVKGMAANDAAMGGITAQDLAAINAKADAIYNEVKAKAAVTPTVTPTLTPPTVAPPALPGPKTMADLDAELAKVRAGWDAGRITHRAVENLVWDLMKRSEMLLNAKVITQAQYDKFRDARSLLLTEVRTQVLASGAA